MRHINIPIFIPHLGCPNMCVFCNQRTISGVKEFCAESVKDIIEQALATVKEDDDVEIAFFGGSFTGIDRQLMVKLLSIANQYIKLGRVDSLRCSTRPDYIDEEILDILSYYGVKTIELGLQSISENVLSATKRGHGFKEEEKACRMIVERGFCLIGQMMIGLPGASIYDELKTADFIISSGASGARIYPTVVFKDTELEKMAMESNYLPLTVEETIERSAKVFARFTEAGVQVIRIGLCSSENLASDKTYYAGPNHPAIGELTINRYYLDRIICEAEKLSLSQNTLLTVLVARGCVSKAIGQKKKNKLLLKETLGIKDVKIKESDFIPEHGIKLETEVQQCI